jgi:hypothetical protein
MRFARHELPAAYAMLDLAGQPASWPNAELWHRFHCCWAAFRLLYTAIAARSGLRPTFVLRRNGTMQTRRAGALKVAQAHPPSEEAQIEVLLGHLGAEAQHALLIHPGTRFFVSRRPTWQGQALGQDAFGQRLNGVIDVALTVDPRYPVWSPIDPKAYGQYVSGKGDARARDALARQVVDLLCTVERNLSYGGPRDDEESSEAVIEHALPLLSTILLYFLPAGSEKAQP